MNALTIRNIPKNVERKVREKAKKHHTSLNKAVISILEEAVGEQEPQKQQFSDLDYLAGTWNDKEADEFDARLSKMRTIDKELWR